MTEDVRDNQDAPTNPVKAIRLKCRDCTSDQRSEIDNCTVKKCPLYPFRMGKNPYRSKRELTEEQKEQMQERLKKAREQKTVEP